MWRTGEPTANPQIAVELVYGANLIKCFLFVGVPLLSLLAAVSVSVAILAQTVGAQTPAPPSAPTRALDSGAAMPGVVMQRQQQQQRLIQQLL